MISIEKIKQAMKRKSTKPDQGLLLSTGSTTLNLACTGRVDGGFPVGSYVFFVGDSMSGKTWFGHSCLAEATIDKRFDDYRLVYDDVEGGSRMNVERFFGKRLAERIEPPGVDDNGNPVYSDVIEEFYYFVDDLLKGSRPFIYVLDSQDSLSSRAEQSKFDEVKRAHRKGKEVAGSYGDAKAKVHSTTLRKLLGPLRDTGSVLIVLNQTRDSFSLFEKSTYSGGRALQFYATLQLWSSKVGKIERTVRGKKRQLGIKSKIQVRKNRLTGKDHSVFVPILHSCGIDDLGGCVDYLVDENYWKENGGKIVATGLGPDIIARRESLVRRIEEGGLEQDLRELVGMVWGNIEAACLVERKSRYSDATL